MIILKNNNLSIFYKINKFYYHLYDIINELYINNFHFLILKMIIQNIPNIT